MDDGSCALRDEIDARVVRLRSVSAGSFPRLRRMAVPCRTRPQVETSRRAVARAGRWRSLQCDVDGHYRLVAFRCALVSDTAWKLRVGPPGQQPGLEVIVANWARELRLHRASGQPVPETDRNATGRRTAAEAIAAGAVGEGIGELALWFVRAGAYVSWEGGQANGRTAAIAKP